MRTWKLALLGLALLALGCRTNPNEVLMERDLRLQEDKIYHLQACLEDCQAAREATIRENEALKKELAGGDRGAGSDYTRPSKGGPSMEAPSIDLPNSSEDSPPKSRSRKSQTPALEAPAIELPESPAEPPVEMEPGKGSTAIEGTPTTLVINKRLTGGRDRDGRGGDGILVVVEPRDAAGHLIKTPGNVSIVVLDPAQQGDLARVARWDFDASEVPKHFHSNPLGRGLQFELPWPNEPPKNRDLLLFVRFTTADGTKLNVDTKLALGKSGNSSVADQKPKSWSATQSANRASRRTPSSRLKPSTRKSNTSRDLSEADQDSSAPAWSSPGDAERPVREPVEQATRPDRPTWKPYR